MDVFGYGTEEGTRPLLPPGTCWICENSPQQEAMKVIDTRRNSRAGGVSVAVSERKYICEPCATELGQAVGLVDQYTNDRINDELAIAVRERNEAVIELAEARKQQTRVVQIDELSNGFIAAAQDAVIEAVRTELAKSVKKAPAKPAAKPSAS